MKPGKAEPSSDGGVSLNLATAPILERYGGKRGKQALAALALAQMLAPVAKWVWSRSNRSEDYTITVAGADDIYPDLHEWVLARMPERDRKALIASTVASDRGDVCEDVGGVGSTMNRSESAHLRLRYDGSRKQVVKIGGHRVIVAVEREDVPGRTNLPENWRQLMEKISFTATSAEGRDAVVEMINGLLAAKYDKAKPPTLFIPSRYGSGWMRRGDLPPRTLDSVILKEGQLEGLVDDLATFLANEEEYNRVSQPWHRGYLLYGIPGTGKTSVARALANHFGLPTYYLPLGEIEKDADLTSMVSSVEPRSVLLLEDVDVFHAATERNEEKGKTSIAAMLNSLDGIYTPHGLITIMTTNDRKKLDDALIRAGRIDVHAELTSLDEDQAQRLAAHFGREDIDAKEFVGSAPSSMIEVLRRER